KRREACSGLVDTRPRSPVEQREGEQQHDRPETQQEENGEGTEEGEEALPRRPRWNAAPHQSPEPPAELPEHPRWPETEAHAPGQHDRGERVPERNENQDNPGDDGHHGTHDDRRVPRPEAAALEVAHIRLLGAGPHCTRRRSGRYASSKKARITRREI